MRIIARPAFENRRSNPYNWLLYSQLLKRGVEVDEFSRDRIRSERYDVLHLHWPEARLNLRSTRAALSRLIEQQYLIWQAKRRGTRIVWTIHNLNTHEGYHPVLERFLWKFFIPSVDATISLSRAGHEAAIGRYPALRSVPSFVVPHGHYRGMYPDVMDSVEARRMLSLPMDARVITFVGKVRQYKNVPGLLEAFRGYSDPSARLLIAGQANPTLLADEIRSLCGLDSRCTARLDFIPDEDVQIYLRAADLVVLPFSSILNSGSALLALSFDRPVLVPAIGAMTELRELVGPEWVRTYAGEINSDTIASALAWSLSGGRGPVAPLAALDWERIADLTLEALQTVTADPPKAALSGL